MASKGHSREVPPASYIDLIQLFSTMRRIKSYLRVRSTMTELSYDTKQQLDDVDLSSIANEFVCGSEHRMHVLGKF